MGDFNASFVSIVNDNKLCAVNSLLDELSLICCDHKNTSGIDFTYKHEGMGHRTFIDHVFVSESMNQYVSDLTVVDNGVNLSDHNAIMFTLHITESLLVHVSMDEEKRDVQNGHVCWSERNKDFYYETTGMLLESFGRMELPCVENSKCCNNVMHRDIIEQRCKCIVTVLQEATNVLMSAEMQGVSHERIYDRSFQWSSELSKLKQQSIDIHALWQKIGRPKFGVINDERLRVKLKYKNCILQQKRVAEVNRKRILALKLASGDAKSFWRGWRAIKTNNRLKRSHHIISGDTDDSVICNSFGVEFLRGLKDSWADGDNFRKLESMCDCIDIADIDCTMFSNAEIKASFDYIKCGKAAGLDGLVGECVKFAHPSLRVLLKELFEACCKHGYVPENFCGGRVTPIPKKANVYGSYQDFRPVTSVNILAKVFEYCILKKMETCFEMHDLQLGFTAGGGCDNAVFLVKSVIEYFNAYGSNVYVASLDLSKAYDRVNHCKLLMKLFDASVPIDIVLMFSYWFRNLFCIVEWEKHRSMPFKMLSGVRQGGICSCWLFNLYINKLVRLLENSGFGCMFNGVYSGCVFYADDIILMSGSVKKLQKLLDICFSYAEEHDFVFNSKKSCCIMFGRDCNNVNVTSMKMGTEFISWVKDCMYLGIKLVAGRGFVTDIENRRRKFCSAFNDVLLNGGYMSEECIMEILVKQCLPVLTYGVGIWNVSKEVERRIGVCFNRAVRRIFRYHDFESVKHILFGFHVLPIDLYIIRAVLLLIGNALKSSRNVLRVCAMWQRDRNKNMNVVMELGVDYNMSKTVINNAVWRSFEGRVGWV
jgi:hypothetical protein